MKQRITKLTKNGASNFWHDKREFYIVPRYTRALSRGVLVDDQAFLRYDTLEEFKEACRSKFRTWHLDYYQVY